MFGASVCASVGCAASQEPHFALGLKCSALLLGSNLDSSGELAIRVVKCPTFRNLYRWTQCHRLVYTNQCLKTCFKIHHSLEEHLQIPAPES